MGQVVDKDGSQVVLRAPQFVDSDVHDPQGPRLEFLFRTYSCGSWNPACAANADGVCKLCSPHHLAGTGGGVWARSREPLCRVVELPCACVCYECAVVDVALRFEPRRSGSARRIELARPTCSAILRKWPRGL